MFLEVVTLSAQVNSGKLNKVYAPSYTNPYYTVDGISRGFDIYKRNVDPDSVSLGKYKTSTLGGAIRFGVLLTDDSNFSVSLGGERVEVKPPSMIAQHVIKIL